MPLSEIDKHGFIKAGGGNPRQPGLPLAKQVNRKIAGVAVQKNKDKDQHRQNHARIRTARSHAHDIVIDGYPERVHRA
jgi:hypothetical protein